MDQERAALAALASRIAIGQRTVERLRAAFGSLVAADQAPLGALVAAGVGRDRAERLSAARTDGGALLASWTARGLRFLAYEDPDFPDAWRTLAAPPAFVLVEGDIEALTGDLVAIIGTRRKTPYGERVARQLVRAAADRGFGTVAGLAEGIDTVTHHASLACGIPTVAVLAGGHDSLFPKENAPLARKIVGARGCVVSEVTPDILPLRQRFIARNRLVAALARFVVVVEAGIPSGTLTTVGHAVELGREVAAVPGPIDSAVSSGCNKLIADGCIPIWSMEEFTTILTAHAGAQDPIVAAVRRGLRDTDTLAQALGLPVEALLVRLTELELSGALRRENGGYVT